MQTVELFAVLPAIGASASFGAAGLLQHRASRQAPPSGPLRPQLLFDLIRIPAFRWGVILGALGFALQVTALGFGPLGLVQPILASQVLFYLAIAAKMMHRSPDWPLVGAALLTIAGISAFLLAARPSQGQSHFTGAVWPLAAVLAAIVAVCVLLAVRLSSTMRSIALAVAAAVCYGVTAGLVRSVVTSDVSTLLSQWQLYAVIVLGPAGFLLNQNAFQAGVVGSIAVTVITVGDPIVSIIVGALWLGESLSGGPWRITIEVLALLVMVAGIVLLARRSQEVGAHIRGESSDLPEAQ